MSTDVDDVIHPACDAVVVLLRLVGLVSCQVVAVLLRQISVHVSIVVFPDCPENGLFECFHCF